MQLLSVRFICFCMETFTICRTLTTWRSFVIIESTRLLKGGSSLSSFFLRLMALVSMCLDHAGLALFPSVSAFRSVGRIAFPLYCFLLVQGFLHTRDVRAYSRRLLFFAILSEIPFDMLIFGQVFAPMEQNVLFSLLFALMALTCCDALQKSSIQAWIICITLATSAMALRLSFGWLAVALCLCFYYTREKRLHLLLLSGSTLLLYTLSLLLSGVDKSWVTASLYALFSLIPIALYNGRSGLRRPLIRFLFYAAYPAHLLLLVWLRALRIVPPHFLN